MAYLVSNRTMNNTTIKKNSKYTEPTKNCSSLSHGHVKVGGCLTYDTI
jgi:hypothetical protein